MSKVPNAFKAPQADNSLTCERCNTVLILSKSGEGMYCPRFKDTAEGEHTRIRVNEADAYRKFRREAAEAALAEEMGVS